MRGGLAVACDVCLGDEKILRCWDLEEQSSQKRSRDLYVTAGEASIEALRHPTPV